MKRALFFPSYFGSGFGHISRCILLAEELKKRGWISAMVIAGPHAETAHKRGYQVFRPWFPTRPRIRSTVLQAYTFIVDGNIQLIRDGFLRPWRFWAAATEATRIVKKFRPDVLIGDFSLLTWAVGMRLGLPVVQITQSISYPIAPKIIWWEDPPSGVVSPDIRPVITPILSRWRFGEISRVEDLLRGDMYLVPSIPELEPMEGDLKNTYYTGAWFSAKPSAPKVVSRKRTAKSRLYLALGGGGSPFGNVGFYEDINRAFGEGTWQVTVSTGGKFDPRKLSSVPNNITYHKWVDGFATIGESDAVIFHGGHGTTMEAVFHGVPSVVMPFHSEQEGNGRRLETHCAALVVRPTRNDQPRRLVSSRWTYGEFVTCVQPFDSDLAERLRDAVSVMREDTRYYEGAKRLGLMNADYGGIDAAADLVESGI